MAKWNLETVKASMQEAIDGAAQLSMENEALREQLRRAQQSLRNARDSAIEEVAQDLESIGEPIGGVEKYPANFHRMYERNLCIDRIRSLKSTTQGSRK